VFDVFMCSLGLIFEQHSFVDFVFISYAAICHGVFFLPSWPIAVLGSSAFSAEPG